MSNTDRMFCVYLFMMSFKGQWTAHFVCVVATPIDLDCPR